MDNHRLLGANAPAGSLAALAPERCALFPPAAPNRNAPLAHKPARCQAARQTAAPFNLYPNPLSALRRLIALQREHAARAGTKGRGLYSRKGSLQRIGSPPDTRTRDRRRSGRGKKYVLYGLSLGPIGYHPPASFCFASAMITRPPVSVRRAATRGSRAILDTGRARPRRGHRNHARIDARLADGIDRTAPPLGGAQSSPLSGVPPLSSCGRVTALLIGKMYQDSNIAWYFPRIRVTKLSSSRIDYEPFLKGHVVAAKSAHQSPLSDTRMFPKT